MHSIVLCAIVILLPVTPRLASQEPNLTHVAFGGITHDAYLKATNAGANDRLGAVLALSGDTLIVGVPGEDSAATGVNGDGADNSEIDSGAAYVFVRTAAGWVQQAYLKASNTSGGFVFDPGAGDSFGSAVAIDGDTLAIGAPDESSASPGVNGDQLDDSAPWAGAVYVFARDGTVWTQQAYIKASNPDVRDHFGSSVALDGDTLVVGAPGESSDSDGVDGDEGDNSSRGAGAVYVFERSGSTWVQSAYMKASNSQGHPANWAAGDRFGHQVALDGDSFAVSAPNEASDANGVDGDQADDSAPGAGAVYVFRRSAGGWAQEAYLKASNSGSNDLFGGGWLGPSLALDGDTLAVSAFWEASSASGVGGNQDDDSAQRSGAAYVFERDGTSWTQQAYIKASNAEGEMGFNGGDEFGISLALSGDTLVVGAVEEDGGSVGVNGPQETGPTFASGALYAFRRKQGEWTQRAYLKAPNADLGDRFGSVTLDGDLLVGGAYAEDSAAQGVDSDPFNDRAIDVGAAFAFDISGMNASAWTPAGEALAGSFGAPTLFGLGTLAGGSEAQLQLSSSAPVSRVAFVLAPRATPTAFKGGTLVPLPFTAMVLRTTDLEGRALVRFSMPPGIPAASELWAQALIPDTHAVQGVALSNALRGTTP